MRITACNSTYIRKRNRKNVLSLIRQKGTASRSEIVRISRLTPSAAADINKKYENCICIISREGIGAGVILNGELYQGMQGVAGEIGHQTIEPNGPLCNCGNYGCLEAMAGARFLQKGELL